MHNDFGMATANVVSGLRAGADGVAVSIAGLGERTGNSSLEEVVMSLKYLYGRDLGFDTARFREVVEYVAAASSRAIPVWKTIVGTNVFAHESGIHVDGVLKNPQNYEVFSPEEVGLARQLVVGKHSGSHTIVYKFKEFGIELEHEEAQDILAMAREMAVDLKRALFDKELMYVYRDYQRKKASESRVE
jgi:homocitrate synthase NifV